MAYELDYSGIPAGIGVGVTYTDYKFLATMRDELLAAILPLFLPTTSTAAIVSGCVLNGNSGEIYISDGTGGAWSTRPYAGTVIWNNKIYPVLTTNVTGSFSTPYANAVGLKLVDDPNFDTTTDWPNARCSDANYRQIYFRKALQLVTTGWDIAMAGLSYASNTATVGTIVGFIPPSGTDESDFVDPSTHLGIGRWTGWRKLTEANGRVLVGADPSVTWPYDLSLGNTGGEYGHKLTNAEVPLLEHTHQVELSDQGVTSTSGGRDYGNPVAGDTGTGAILRHTVNSGGANWSNGQNGTYTGNATHNNVQPFISVIYFVKI